MLVYFSIQNSVRISLEVTSINLLAYKNKKPYHYSKTVLTWLLFETVLT